MKVTKTLTAVAAGIALALSGAAYAGHAPYEVWGFDQSHDHDSGASGADRDGILYVWSGKDNDFKQGNATTESYNWEDTLEDFYGVGNVPGGFGQPHMTLWNTGATHLIVGHTSGNSGVAIVDGDTRTVTDATTVGGNSHAAIPSHGNDFILVSNISNQKLHKLGVDYTQPAGSQFTGVNAELDMVAAGVPAAIGAGSAKPICPIITESDAYSYITLAAGGLAIVDNATMTVAHTYTVDEGLDLVDADGSGTVEAGGQIGQNGCGGIEKDGIVYINSATKNPENGSDVYAFNNAQLEADGSKPDFIRIQQNGNDSHGMVTVGNYLWGCNRGSNTCNVHDNVSAAGLFLGAGGSYDPAAVAPEVASDPIRIINVVDLQGSVLGDTAPDLVDVSPSGKLVFIAQRGPGAFSANSSTFHNAEGSQPGLGVVQVTGNGKDGKPKAHYDVSRFDLDDGDNIADVHAIRVRK